MKKFLKNIFNKNQLGLTILKLEDFYLDDLERNIKTIRAETKIPSVGIRHRVVKTIDYSDENNEYTITSIIDVPRKFKEMRLNKGKIEIKEREEMEAREIFSIIQLRPKTVIVFSKAQKEVRFFNNYLREVTLGGINPISIKFKNEKMKDFLRFYINVSHLKFFKLNKENIRTLTFKGMKLLEDQKIKDVLLDDIFELSEIGGSLPLPSDKISKIYFNASGRIRLTLDYKELNITDLYYLIEEFEKMY